LQVQGQRQQQIPCRNDRKKSKGNDNGNGNSRFPAGMTERKARTTTARAIHSPWFGQAVDDF
jgi:hypothetical protein